MFHNPFIFFPSADMNVTGKSKGSCYKEEYFHNCYFHLATSSTSTKEELAITDAFFHFL